MRYSNSEILILGVCILAILAVIYLLAGAPHWEML